MKEVLKGSLLYTLPNVHLYRNLDFLDTDIETKLLSHMTSKVLKQSSINVGSEKQMRFLSFICDAEAETTAGG